MTARENRTGLYEMPNDPELPDLFRVQLRQAALQLSTHSVARVVASSTHPLGYNPATQTAAVQVEILQVVKDNFTQPNPASPNPVNLQTPVLLDGVKVKWTSTASGRFTLPLVIGDTGELHVQDRSIDRWRQTGIPSDPVSAFIHMLGDSVFHPSKLTDVDPLVPPTSQAAAVIDGPLVHLGALATEPLLLGIGFGTPMATYITALNTASLAWDASLKDPAATVVYLNAISAAVKIFFASIASWLSTKSFTE